MRVTTAAVRLTRLAALLAAGIATAQPDPCAGPAVQTAVQQVSARRALGAGCGDRGHFGPAARLTWSPVLEGLAREQAAWLVDVGLLVHTGRDGETLSQRAMRAGYRYARIAENLAHGQADVAAVLAAWQASTGHCANLFDPQVTEMALACAAGHDGRALWVLVLGRQL